MGLLTRETLTGTDATQDYTDLFNYDPVGNRLVSTHAGPGGGADETVANTYNGDDELTKEVSSIALSGETDLAYDPNGSLTTSTPPTGSGQLPTTYGYSVRNKMISADVNGVITGYVYDDAGDRVQETTGGVTTYFLADNNNPTNYAQPIEQKLSATAAPMVTYVIGDHVLAQVNTVAGTPVVSYLLTDGHGSTRALTDSGGTMTQTFNYTAFGNAIGFNPATVANAGTIFLFGGDAVYDPPSGLYLNGDGTRVRDEFFFMQMNGVAGNIADPISLHNYLYANGNPIDGADPTGQDDLVETLTSEDIGEDLDSSENSEAGRATSQRKLYDVYLGLEPGAALKGVARVLLGAA